LQVVLAALGEDAAWKGERDVTRWVIDEAANLTKPDYSDWTQVDQQDASTAYLVDVPVDTPEYRRVIQEFNSGGFAAKVFQVQRVQHQQLYESYWQAKLSVAKANNGDANELWMKHGTATTPPRIVYESPFGFDFRYSKVGMFGQAAYFAFDAEYSHGYASTLPGGQKQMFLARVAAGRIEDRNPDTSIRHPTFGYNSIRGTVRSPHKVSQL
jgi:hypothetical protein